MANVVILTGNLSRDVELRYTSNGTAIAKTGIAVNKKFKNAAGEMKEEVMFIDITFFGRTAEVANQYIRKGSKILVEGELVLEQWKAQDGTSRSKHSVKVNRMEMLGGKTNGQEAEAPKAPAKEAPAPQAEAPQIDIDEDEIPF